MKDQLEQNWQEFFWGGFYADAWGFRIDPQKAEQEVNGVLKLLNPPPDSHILDWCGGYGRHSVIFAQRGFKVTLLDFTPSHIQMAEQAAKATGVELSLIQADFRQTPPSIQADFAVNLFTSGIGYLTEQDDLLALQSLHAALKPEALFLLDTMNLFWLVKNYQPKGGDMSEDRTKRLVEQREFDFWRNRNISQILYWKKGGEEVEQRLEHRIYSAAELMSVLRQAGFEPLELYGGFDGQPFGFDSRRLIIISKRR